MDCYQKRNQEERYYDFEQSLQYIEMVRKSGEIILGGDVLDEHGDYTYINWFFQPNSKDTASSDSCDHAKEFITGLVHRDKYQYLFVTSTYDECMVLRSLIH